MKVYAYEPSKAIRLYSAAKIRALIAEDRATKQVSKEVNIKLRIDRETQEALQKRAAEAERTVAAEIRLAIRAHLAPPATKGSPA